MKSNAKDLMSVKRVVVCVCVCVRLKHTAARLSDEAHDEDKGWTGHMAILIVNGTIIDFFSFL